MARSNPITWRNVSINDGSSSAALGNAAAGFGRAATQGLDILNTQLQDRIDREDTLLTNEAIAQALSGGPVSANRRVDHDALSVALERQAQGVRAERTLEDNLLSSAVNRRVNTLTGDKTQKDIDTYDERWKLEQELKKAQIANQQQQSATSAYNLKVAEDNFNRLIQQRAGEKKLGDFLYTQRPQQIRDELLATPEIAAVQAQVAAGEVDQGVLDNILEQETELRISELERDPDYLPRLALDSGLDMTQFLASPQGQEWQQVRQLRFQADLEAGKTRLETKTANLEAAQEYLNNGNAVNAVWSPSSPGGFTFRAGGKPINENDAKTYADNAGLDVKDKEVQRAIGQVRTHFPEKTTYREIIGKIQRDGELMDNWEVILTQARADVESAAQIMLSGGDQAANPNLTLAQRVNARLNGGVVPQEGGGGAGGDTDGRTVSKAEQDLQETLGNLGVDNLQLHPDKEGDRKAIVANIKSLADQVESQRRPGGRLPLSTQEIARLRQELQRAIERAQQPPLAPIPPGINIGIQPK